MEHAIVVECFLAGGSSSVEGFLSQGAVEAAFKASSQQAAAAKWSAVAAAACWAIVSSRGLSIDLSGA
jgi:hypothetical protein